MSEHIEAAWDYGRLHGEFMVVELFEGEQLVACDFTHIVPGGSLYVATRYHAKTSALSPGFLLAFLTARWAQNLGFAIWDLGQTDANPAMHYKQVTSHVVSRATHLQRMRCTDRSAPRITVSQGVVLARAEPHHLFGAAGH